MTGFDIDPVALENAIKKLEGPRDKADQIARSAQDLESGELSAKDPVTKEARKKFNDLASGSGGSLRSSAQAVRDKLTEKIDAYRATLEEYRRAEDAATVDADRVGRQQ